jgi:hypothetical protein
MLLYVIIYWVLSKYPFLLKEFKMSVLSRQTDESAAIVENTENLLSESANNKARDGIAPMKMPVIKSRLRRCKALHHYRSFIGKKSWPFESSLPKAHTTSMSGWMLFLMVFLRTLPPKITLLPVRVE